MKVALKMARSYLHKKTKFCNSMVVIVFSAAIESFIIHFFYVPRN